MILYSALGDMFAHLELKRRESNERKAVLTTISVEQHSLFMCICDFLTMSKNYLIAFSALATCALALAAALS